MQRCVRCFFMRTHFFTSVFFSSSVSGPVSLIRESYQKENRLESGKQMKGFITPSVPFAERRIIDMMCRNTLKKIGGAVQITDK